MTVKKCDKCGKEINVLSTFTSRRMWKVNVAEDWENNRYEEQLRTKKFDLCPDCAGEIEKFITGYYPPEKLL